MINLILIFGLIDAQSEDHQSDETKSRIRVSAAEKKHQIKQRELGNKYIFDPGYIDGVLQPPKYEKLALEIL